MIIFSTIPQRAQASFFDNILKFFGGQSQTAAAAAEVSSDGFSLPLLGSQHAPALPPTAGPAQDDTSLVATQDNALVSTHNPLGTLPNATSDQIVVYTVEPGDTPSGIAARFGISLNTLLWANDLRSASAIRAGDDLIILPVTGVQYEVKRGDTIEAIAKKFRADVMDIISFNGLAIGEPLKAGDTIIIPDGELGSPQVNPATPRRSPVPSTASRFAGLPDLKGFLMRPIAGGRRSQGLHGFNGVDLADTCSMPVYASAGGTVIIARTSGWNGGYGKYVVIAHPNGVQTLYAHLSETQISTGATVSQGVQIGLIGRTGNVTGCHVHFEVRGARNPF